MNNMSGDQLFDLVTLDSEQWQPVLNPKKIDIYNTNKKFKVLYADPPWSYNDKQNSKSHGGATKHYDLMSLKDICEMPIKNIVEENAVLFMWTTAPLLEDSFKVLKAWGFKYKTNFVWDKIDHNMGHYSSVRHEHLLVATKGSCLPGVRKLIDSVQSIKRSKKHSEKPLRFLALIDMLYPSPEYNEKLELFARRSYNENWHVFGNEI